MIQSRSFWTSMATLAAILLTSSAGLAQDRQAQHIFTPMASPRAEVAQRVGLTDVEVIYHRPAVNERDVWGQVVPSTGSIWRTGANENTLVSFSTDVTVQGRDLPAGTYGLHTIVGQPADQQAWTIIFSKDVHAWGSYSYKEENDALRVMAMPKKAPHKERFEISFDNLENDSADLVLHWAEVAVPVKVSIDFEKTVTASFRQQLTGLSQFFWQGWDQAAQYSLNNDINLEEAMEWADNSISVQENFSNLSTKAQLLTKRGESSQADELMAKAMTLGNAGQIHNYARRLLREERTQEALELFKMNVKKHPDAWFVELGLARAYSALGQFEDAAKNMKLSLEKAPEAQQPYIQGLVEQLNNKVDINN